VEVLRKLKVVTEAAEKELNRELEREKKKEKEQDLIDNEIWYDSDNGNAPIFGQAVR
jgi:hypothetical protein